MPKEKLAKEEFVSANELLLVGIFLCGWMWLDSFPQDALDGMVATTKTMIIY